jgi:carbonic anhydrase/acetyltransferase-like protein (isoleucine patch superfamily)
MIKNHRSNEEKGIRIAPSAVVVGDVFMGNDVSIWHHATLRADINTITLGEGTNIQDNCVIHVSYDAATVVGDFVTVGHSAILHGCTIHDHVIIGMGAIVLDKAIIHSNVIVAAGSVVAPGKVLESGYLYMGSPAVQKRPLTEDEMTMIKENAEHYIINKSQL